MPSDFLGRGGEVARDHDDLNACRLAVGHGLWNFRAQGIGQSDQPQPLKIKVVGAVGVALAFEAAVRHGQHTQALRSHLCHTAQPVLTGLRAQVAQVHDGFGRAFGRDHMRVFWFKLPNMRHGFQAGAEGVGLHQLTFSKGPLGFAQVVFPHGVKSRLHGVKRCGGAGQNGVFNQRVKRLGQGGGEAC